MPLTEQHAQLISRIDAEARNVQFPGFAPLRLPNRPAHGKRARAFRMSGRFTVRWRKHSGCQGLTDLQPLELHTWHHSPTKALATHTGERLHSEQPHALNIEVSAAAVTSSQLRPVDHQAAGPNHQAARPNHQAAGPSPPGGLGAAYGMKLQHLLGAAPPGANQARAVASGVRDGGGSSSSISRPVGAGDVKGQGLHRSSAPHATPR